MRIDCPSCKKVYKIPDERLPNKDAFALKCPSCKGIIKINLSEKTTTAPPKEKAPVVQEQTSSVEAPPPQDEQGANELKERILNTVNDLPPMPQTIFKAREIMSDPDSSFTELANVLELDQALATKVLKMSNSAYYGLVGKVSSIQHASVVLGFKTLGELITMASSSEVLGDMLEGYGLAAGDLWQHSLAVGFGSKVIAEKKNAGLANDAFATGLIHDIGKLVLDPYILEMKGYFDALLQDGGTSFLSAENEILGFDHSEIASELCSTWNIPEDLAHAIRYHHKPSESDDDDLTYIIHVADSIAMMSGLGVGDDGLQYSMDNSAVERIGLKDDDLSGIICEVVESVGKLSETAPAEEE